MIELACAFVFMACILLIPFAMIIANSMEEIKAALKEAGIPYTKSERERREAEVRADAEKVGEARGRYMARIEFLSFGHRFWEGGDKPD